MTTLLDMVANKAADEIWQRPNQDRVARFSAKPITTDRGVSRTVNAGKYSVSLPDNTNKYVVYDLGQLNPNLYGFDLYLNNWFSLEAISNADEMLIQPLLNNRRLPMKHTYMIRTEYRATLIAVRVDKAFDLFSSYDDLAISFYSNAWLNTTPGKATGGITVSTFDIDTTTNLTAFMTALAAARSGSGNLMCFVNGLYLEINASTDLSLGDYAELIQDESGIGYYDIKLSSAPFFLSTRDSKGKYLLLAPDNATNDVVRYKDDINIVIFNEVNDSIGGIMKRGVIYDLFNDSDIRMVTHRDHSIDSVRVKNILLSQNNEVINSNAYARVYVRNADVDRFLPNDGNYINDMYLFSRDERKRFMTGTFAVLDKWKADNLESSPYTTWLGLNRYLLNYESLKSVFSNHGLYDIVETPIKNAGVYKLPPIAFDGGMAILYDTNMELHSTQTITSVQAATGTYTLPAGTEYLEFIPGELVADGGQMESSSLVKDPQGKFAEQYFVRDSSNEWIPAIEGTHYQTNLEDETVDWLPAYVGTPKLKRDSGKFHSHQLSYSRSELMEYKNIFLGGDPSLEFETARVDIWLNKRKLIRNLDYEVKWPKYRIHNVEYLAAGANNDVLVVAHGLPQDKSDNTFDFIKYNHVNYDERFRLSFNRPNNITVDGKIGIADELSFSERRTNTANPIYREGAPYIIDNPVNHMPIVYQSELTESTSAGLANTSAIEDYLTDLDKENIVPVVTTISNKHEIVSYVLSALIDDLNAGNIKIFNDSFSVGGVASIMSKYRVALETDPGRRDDWDWNYILLAAHNGPASVGVSSLHYSFLAKVVEYYFSDRCQINNYMHIV